MIEADVPDMDDRPTRGELIWSRLAASPKFATAVQVAPPASSAKPKTADSEPTHTKTWWWSRVRWHVLDLLGTLLWIYIPIKLLVIDLDRVLVSALAPGLLPLLDYRFIATLVSLALLALLVRRWWFYFLYVAGFPVVVVFWKVPYFLVRRRSWATFLGLLQVFVVLFSDLRWNIITKSLATVAGLLILLTDIPSLVSGAALYLIGLMIWSLVRRLRRILGTPSFIEVQRRTIHRVMRSGNLRSMITLKDEYLTGDLTRYDDTQAESVTSTIAYAIGATKLLHLWAYQLDRYRRRYSPSVVFNVISYTWVFISALIGMALVNFALLKLDSGQYAVDGPRPPIAVLVYSLSTFWLGEAGGMHPIGQLAYLVQFVGGLTGALILGALLLNLYLSWVRERDDTATESLITELRDEARVLERTFAEDYSVSTDEGLARLHEFGVAAASLASWVARVLPQPDIPESPPP